MKILMRIFGKPSNLKLIDTAILLQNLSNQLLFITIKLSSIDITPFFQLLLSYRNSLIKIPWGKQ